MPDHRSGGRPDDLPVTLEVGSRGTESYQVKALEKDDCAAKELGVRFWQDPMPALNGQLLLVDEPWAGMQRGEYSYLGCRDTNYLQTYPYFKLCGVRAAPVHFAGR